MLRRFVAEDSGATAIEYALVASLMAMAILMSIHALSDSVAQLYQTIVGASSSPPPAH